MIKLIQMTSSVILLIMFKSLLPVTLRRCPGFFQNTEKKTKQVKTLLSTVISKGYPRVFMHVIVPANDVWMFSGQIASHHKLSAHLNGQAWDNTSHCVHGPACTAFINNPPLLSAWADFLLHLFARWWGVLIGIYNVCSSLISVTLFAVTT